MKSLTARPREARGIIAGRQSMFRRIAKPQPLHLTGLGRRVYADTDFKKSWEHVPGMGESLDPYRDCPYGRPGDRLIVKETVAWSHDGRWIYRADGEVELDRRTHWIPASTAKPSMSRITLEITDVRIERLQDLSEEEAEAEGIACRDVIVRTVYEANQHREITGQRYLHGKWPGCDVFESAVDAYADLWESSNGPGSWELNPWVWVVGFKRVMA